MQQAGALVFLMGDYNKAVTEAEKAVAIAPGDGLTCFNAACTYANISVAAGRDVKLPERERQRLAERYASRATELLRQAKQAGWFQRRGAVASLTNDPDLIPLREREDFTALMRELHAGNEAKRSK
jgi:hypothetical protein